MAKKIKEFRNSRQKLVKIDFSQSSIYRILARKLNYFELFRMKYSKIFSNFGAKIQKCQKIKFCQNWLFEQKYVFCNSVKYIFKVKVTNSFRLIFKFTLIFASPFFAGPTVFGAKTKQQFFVVKPQDSEVGQGGSVVLPCEVGDRRGRVQWTKDGLTLGKKPTFLVNCKFSSICCFRPLFE